VDENHRPADNPRPKNLHREKAKMRNLHPKQDLSLSIHLQIKQQEEATKYLLRKA
jgi:hypothetical protein